MLRTLYGIQYSNTYSIPIYLGIFNFIFPEVISYDLVRGGGLEILHLIEDVSYMVSIHSYVSKHDVLMYCTKGKYLPMYKCGSKKRIV